MMYKNKKKNKKNAFRVAIIETDKGVTLRRVYRYIPSKKWDSESILNTF